MDKIAREEVWESFPMVGFDTYEWEEHTGLVRSWSNPGGGRRSVAKVLKRTLDKDGYLVWSLTDTHGKKRRVCLHQLVCTKYHGDKPAGGQVRHLDGNPRNNLPGNLLWGTSRENHQDRKRHGTSPSWDRYKNSKLTPDTVRSIRAERSMSCRALAGHFGVSNQLISRVRSGQCWRHVQ